jgi:hypothetical protein
VDDGKSVSQVIEELPTLGNNPMVSSMNDRDKLVQKKVLTVILSALCYLNTKDPDVRKYKFHDRPKLGRIPPDAVVIGERFERMPPGWHLRKAHFRMLTHERFHRDDAGQVRVRWVREAEVGKGREPAGEKAKEIDVSQRGE